MQLLLFRSARFFLIIIFGTGIEIVRLIDYETIWLEVVRNEFVRCVVVHPPVTPDVLERSTFKNRKKKAERSGKMQMGWRGRGEGGGRTRNVQHFVKHFVLEWHARFRIHFLSLLDSWNCMECRMKNWQDRMNRILEYSLQKFRRGGGGRGEKLNILSNEMLYIYKYIFIRKTVWFTVMDNMKESFS